MVMLILIRAPTTRFHFWGTISVVTRNVWCTTRIYSGSTIIFTVKNVKSEASCIELKGDIDSIFSWSQKWRMIFNISKCFIITFTRLKNPVSFNYSTDRVTLKSVTEVQDLGVTLDSALQWNIHVKNIISKANRVRV